MNRAEFETELSTQGYGEIVDRRMEVNAVNPEHAHEFDAQLLVLEGEMTIASGGEERTYRAGDTFAMAAAIPPAGGELAGRLGVAVGWPVGSRCRRLEPPLASSLTVPIRG